jgi:hypothetical protein
LRTSRQFDAIVIGSGLGGLTAGALYARAGHRVLVIERNQNFGGAATVYRHGALAIEASLHEIDGLDPKDPKAPILQSLGLDRDVPFVDVGDLHEVRSPLLGEPFVLPHGLDAALNAAKQRFPRQGNGLDGYFERICAVRHAVSTLSEHRLVVRLRSNNADEPSDSPDDLSLTIPWQKPSSKRSRHILLPYNASRSDVRPEQFERRARLVSAIARGRRWLDDVVSGRVTTVAQLCAREKCSVRQVNMTISLAFLAPNLVKAAVEGRLPRGIGIERLRDPPTEWSRQFEALGLNPG